MSGRADEPGPGTDLVTVTVEPEPMDFRAVSGRLKHGVFNMVQTSQLSVCQTFQLTPT